MRRVSIAPSSHSLSPFLMGLAAARKTADDFWCSLQLVEAKERVPNFLSVFFALRCSWMCSILCGLSCRCFLFATHYSCVLSLRGLFSLATTSKFKSLVRRVFKRAMDNGDIVGMGWGYE